MAKFTFKFETVRRHRQMLEDQRQRELAQTLRQRFILQNQLRTMQQSISQSKHELGGSLVGKVDLNQVAQFAGYSGQVTLRAQALVMKLASLERQVEEARARLLQAAKARKALDLLRERYFTQWVGAQERREAAELDDLTVTRFARQAALEVEP